MAELSLAEELRAHLVTNGLVQLPGDAGDLPVCRLPAAAADDGQLEPATKDKITVDLEVGPRIPSRGAFFDSYVERRLVDVVVRARRPWDAELLQRQVGRLLAEVRHEYFNDLLVEVCRIFTGDQETGSTARFIERTQTFLVDARVKSLAGEPLTP